MGVGSDENNRYRGQTAVSLQKLKEPIRLEKGEDKNS